MGPIIVAFLVLAAGALTIAALMVELFDAITLPIQ